MMFARIRCLSWLFAAALLAAGCQKKEDATTTPNPGTPAATAIPGVTKLKIEDPKPGTGATAEKGDVLYMLYTGKFLNGKVFDSTDSHDGKPLTLTLGQGEVIKGWDQGLVGMKVGGKRKLSIPYALAYGEAGQPPNIPAKSDLIFDVELLDVLKKGEQDLIVRKEIKPGAGRAVKKGDTITINYKGTTVGGKEFDSTTARKAPYTFKVGSGKVKEFMDIAVTGMQKGGKRMVRVPPMLGYGASGFAGVGPNQILYYEVELLDIK